MIAICPNPFRDTELVYTRRAIALLENAGFETAVCPVFAEDDPDIMPPDIPCRDLEQVAPQCSLIIVIGGDGTILSVARTLHAAQIPLLGVNLGTKGFMAALEPEELEQIVRAARGECKISRRMLLSSEPSISHCAAASHSASWWVSSRRFFDGISPGVSSPYTRASIRQKRFCGWP